MDDVIIMGGGLAGGVCAQALRRRGLKATVIEKSRHNGGLARTTEKHGHSIDLGPHFFFHGPELEHVRKWVDDETGIVDHKPFAWSLPTGDVDDPHDYPVSWRNVLRWPDSGLVSAELERASNATPNPEGSFEARVRDMVGPRLYQRYFENYTRKFWGTEPSQLRGNWVSRKIRVTREHEPFFGDRHVYRPKGGMGALISCIFEDGAHILRDEVMSLAIRHGQIDGVITKAHGVLRARHYVSTIRPDILFPTGRLQVRALVLLYASLNTCCSLFPTIPDVLWAHVPNNHGFTRVSDMTRCTDTVAPKSTILCFEYPCDTDSFDDIGVLIDDAERFIARNLAGRSACDVSWEYECIDDGYPVPSYGNASREGKVNSLLSQFSNLSRLGRFGSFTFSWMGGTVNEALVAADRIEETLRGRP